MDKIEEKITNGKQEFIKKDKMGTPALKNTVSVLRTQWLSIKLGKNEQKITEPKGKLKENIQTQINEEEQTLKK